MPLETQNWMVLFPATGHICCHCWNLLNPVSIHPIWFCFVLVVYCNTNISFHFLLKVNRSVYMTSCTYRFCWQHAIILVWKTWSRVKGRVCYIFTSLFCKFKEEHLRNKEKCFLFHLKISFHSWDNQILILQIFKCYYVIKCPSMKHQTHFTE